MDCFDFFAPYRTQGALYILIQRNFDLYIPRTYNFIVNYLFMY